MALPDNTLSSEPIIGDFVGAAALEIQPTHDYEDGPVALRDPSLGLMYQVWEAVIVSKSSIMISAPSVPEFEFLSGTNISEVSIAFDQNANLYCCYILGGTTYLYWFDSTVQQNVTTNFGTTVTPKITLDDKRRRQNIRSDVIFTYIRDGILYYRQQRDRFQTERQLSEEGVTAIYKVGMTDKLRLQWLIER